MRPQPSESTTFVNVDASPEPDHRVSKADVVGRAEFTPQDELANATGECWVCFLKLLDGDYTRRVFDGLPVRRVNRSCCWCCCLLHGPSVVRGWTTLPDFPGRTS